MTLYLKRIKDSTIVSLGIIYISFYLQMNVHYTITMQALQMDKINFGIKEFMILFITPLTFFGGVLLLSRQIIGIIGRTKIKKNTLLCGLFIAVFGAGLIILTNGQQPLSPGWSFRILTSMILIYSCILVIIFKY